MSNDLPDSLDFLEQVVGLDIQGSLDTLESMVLEDRETLDTQGFHEKKDPLVFLEYQDTQASPVSLDFLDGLVLVVYPVGLV